MKKYLHAFVLLMAAAVSSNAQSFTVNGPRTVYELPSNKGTNKYTFFNLESGREIAPADSNTTKWDIAFCTTSIILNGSYDGTTRGPGSVTGQFVSSTTFKSLTEAPAEGYNAVSFGSGSWYKYNYIPADQGPHSITAIADKVLVVQLADGRYAKIQILNYYKGVPDNIPTTGPIYTGVGQYITFRYLISDEASIDLSSSITEVTSLYAAGKNYQFFNFTAADTVAVADSATVKWDVAFKGTTILVNGGGTSGVSTVTAQVVFETSFDGLTEAPATGYLYDGQVVTKRAILTGSGNGWYKYNSVNNAPPHTITPIADRIIVLKLADGRYVKLQILNYYLGAPKDVPVAGTTDYEGVGSYYTFRYTISDPGSNDITTNADGEPVTTGVFTASAKPVSIYPNPLAVSGNTLTISSPVNTGNVRILDLLGNEVYTSTMQAKTTTLTNLNLSEGMYVVVLESEGNLYQQKLVVE